jgi:hypothetical protein
MHCFFTVSSMEGHKFESSGRTFYINKFVAEKVGEKFLVRVK